MSDGGGLNAPGWAGESTAYDARDARSIRRRELLWIVAFWTLFGLLTTANRLLDPRGNGFRGTVTSAPVLLAFFESFLWALLTPLVFYAAARATETSGPSHSPTGAQRALRILALVVLGVAAAMLVDGISGLVRGALFPFPVRRGPAGGGRGDPVAGFPFMGFRRLWIVNDLVIYCGVLATGIARAVSIRSRAERDRSVRLEGETSRLHAQLAEARLDALRMQLDPHFLFNTLNAISSLVERDPRGVRRMIARLSDLLRHSIEGSGEPEQPLRVELELVRRYVEIMEVRFQGKLDVRIDVADDACEVRVPTLILQPIVENAMKHGVSRIEGVGRIAIEGRLDGNTLLVRVTNDGPPVGPASAVERATGVGVRNTRARLEHLYGADASFTLAPSPDGSGTVAELRIPARAPRATVGAAAAPRALASRDA